MHARTCAYASTCVCVCVWNGGRMLNIYWCSECNFVPAGNLFRVFSRDGLPAHSGLLHSFQHVIMLVGFFFFSFFSWIRGLVQAPGGQGHPPSFLVPGELCLPWRRKNFPTASHAKLPVYVTDTYCFVFERKTQRKYVILRIILKTSRPWHSR